LNLVLSRHADIIVAKPLALGSKHEGISAEHD